VDKILWYHYAYFNRLINVFISKNNIKEGEKIMNMKESIKLGIGFTLGLIIVLLAIALVDDLFHIGIKGKTKIY